MKTDDKNIEHILRGLADYRPPATPDWDSFYDKNKKDIEASAGSMAKSGFRKLTSSVWPRNILIGLGLVIGIFAGFYFLSSDSSDMQIEDNSPIIDNNNNLENTFVVEPVENELTTDNEPETASEPDQNLINNESTEIREIEEIEKKGEVDEIKKVETGTDINTEEPVIIKKTVIINDTIRVTKPIKK